MARPPIAVDTANIGNVPAGRLTVVADFDPNARGLFVVYWMTAARRLQWNFALDRAIGWARALKRPLVVVEVLACGGRWDSDRHHAFVLQGMRHQARQSIDAPALYYPYVESKAGASHGLFAALCRQACVVVTDDFPLPSVATPAAAAAVRFEKVDGNGLLPLRAADRAYPTAFAFRRFLQRTLPEYLHDAPRPVPFARVTLPPLSELPETIARRWPAAAAGLLQGDTSALAMLPIDHRVPPVAAEGGAGAARARWRLFLGRQMASYPALRSQPEEDATSGLAPYLHLGHISAHQVFFDMVKKEGWSPAALAERASGSREGWWGMSEAAEAFLDQLVTWRELGFNFCAHRADYAEYRSLPTWATGTLAKHARDRRAHRYGIEEFAAAQTHDPLWNAAQRQLIVDGRIHNYLRMLWGKKILEWTPCPEEALGVMIELNNRYALDGQDPNSYSGIMWTLGRYDRPWGPERPVFGTIRYMSSENTARKVRVAGYLCRYSASALTGPTAARRADL